jgi:iron complex outermembrane recepter protein
MKFFTPLILFVLSAVSFSNGQSGGIKGIVSSVDGSPAPYVNITIKETNQGMASAEDGRFHFKKLAPGQYTLITSFIGLETQSKTVVVTSGSTVDVNFTLAENSQQLSEIVIFDTRSMNDRPASIGKTYIKPMDLPQSVVVLDKSVLERQQTLRLSDVLMNANGVYIMGASGGVQEEIAGRGFAYGSSNTFKNGSRFNNAIMPEVSALDRVEILKGSNAILFGNVAAGGVLNLVTKKPKFEQGGEISFRAGSYDFFKPTLDLYGGVNNSEHVAYRINTSYENARSFRNDVNSERIYFNPSFLVKAGKKTDILVEGDYLKDRRTLDYGTGAIDYKIIDIDRSTFLGASWSYNNAVQKSATLTITHDLTPSWQLRSLSSFQGFDNELFGTTRPNAGIFVQADGKWLRGIQRTATSQEYYITQLDAIGKVVTGAIEHNLLIGADIDSYRNSSLAYTHKNPLANPKVNNGNVYDSINVFDLNLYQQRTDMPQLARNTRTTNPISRSGFYAQDLLSISEKIKILAGIRFTMIESESDVFNYSTEKTTNTSYSDNAFTPRLGIVYQPVKFLSLFSSYANSFTLNTAIDPQGQALPPSFIDQYEAGAKTELIKGILSANITGYKIVNSNLAQPVLSTSPDYNPDYPNAQQLAGEVTSKGIEVDLMSKVIRGFSFIAGYSYNDTRYTKSDQFIVGSRLRYNPSHTANASVSYAFNTEKLKGLNVGLIGFYMGQRVAGRSTQTNTPNDTRKLMAVDPYFQVDATAGYSFRSLSFRVKLSNVLNELSYNVHDDNSVNPIAPRMIATSIGYKF